MEIHVLHRQGESIRAIARKLDVSHNTVRRYLRDLSMVPTYPDRTQRATKLDPYKDYLLARIEAAKPHWIPATVLLREIQDRGYDSGISQIKCYITDFKTVESDPVVRFETPPGKQMQVDFTTISRHRRKIKAFVATLGFSRATYVRFSEHERQDDWLQGIKDACHYFGGVPQEILFDYVARNIIVFMVNALKGGGVEPDLSLAVTPLCRCRFGQTSESAHKNNNSSQAGNSNPFSYRIYF